MTRLESVIVDIKNLDSQNHAWIFENGKIRDDVLCGDVIPLLEELKEYEINCTDNAIEKIINISNGQEHHWNTYNWNANIDHDIDVAECNINGYTYMAIMVHRYGDVRANYTDKFLVRFDNDYEFFELESLIQYKTICYDKEISENRYCVDINLMSEGYNVYDWKNNENIGEFYELEKSDLLNAINEIVNKQEVQKIDE